MNSGLHCTSQGIWPRNYSTPALFKRKSVRKKMEA